MKKILLTPKIKIVLMVITILVVTGFPYLQEGLYSSWYPDLIYHLLRVEGVKGALLEGQYPVRIYNNFFNGYGYGSPLFYPDIFLIIPAVLRILSISPIDTWKIFSLIITLTATLTTFYSVKYISKDEDCAIVATFMIMLSQFYLADLHDRVGISEYLAFVFIPILFAGIYDFFVCEGKKTYLMGIGFVGLLLSHTIMTFIGIVITSFIFVGMLFVKRENNYLFNKYKMKNLIVTAALTIGTTAYYLFPMLEQMLTDVEFEYMSPWTMVGQNTQPIGTFFLLRGGFDLIAYLGIGVPILILLTVCFFLKKPKEKWGRFFLLSGLVLFLITADTTLWRMLQETAFNIIQFTYRLYPYAIVSTVLGITIILTANLGQKVYKKYILMLIIICSIICGWYQNKKIVIVSDESKMITSDYLKKCTNEVGAGEWLPSRVSDEVLYLTAPKDVVYDERSYIYPLIYYKGYEAWTYSETGDKINFPVGRSEEDLVRVIVENESNEIIHVEYTGTFTQKISNIISAITIIGIGVICVTKIQKSKKFSDKNLNQK